MAGRERRHPLPRGVRPRARGRPHRQGRLRLHRPGGRAGGEPAGDPGRRRHRWAPSGGPSAVDDEGHPPGRNVLIEDGVLTDYMWDYLRARKEGRASSGNGRRQSYRHLPMVRMTNTFLLTATEPARRSCPDPARCLRGQARWRSGQHDHGDFVFGTDGGLPHRGRQLTEPLRDANLIGNGPEIAQAHRRGRERLRDDPGHLREGRPERPRRVRTGDPAAHRA